MNLFYKALTLLTVILLSSCVSMITAPIGLAYDVTKGVVKGTVAVVDAVTPDFTSNDDKSKSSDKK